MGMWWLPWAWLQGPLGGAGELMTGTSAAVGTKTGDPLSHPRGTLTKQIDKSQIFFHLHISPDIISSYLVI